MFKSVFAVFCLGVSVSAFGQSVPSPTSWQRLGDTRLYSAGTLSSDPHAYMAEMTNLIDSVEGANAAAPVFVGDRTCVYVPLWRNEVGYTPAHYGMKMQDNRNKDQFKCSDDALSSDLCMQQELPGECIMNRIRAFWEEGYRTCAPAVSQDEIDLNWGHFLGMYSSHINSCAIVATRKKVKREMLDEAVKQAAEAMSAVTAEKQRILKVYVEQLRSCLSTVMDNNGAKVCYVNFQKSFYSALN